MGERAHRLLLLTIPCPIQAFCPCAAGCGAAKWVFLFTATNDFLGPFVALLGLWVLLAIHFHSLTLSSFHSPHKSSCSSLPWCHRVCKQPYSVKPYLM